MNISVPYLGSTEMLKRSVPRVAAVHDLSGFGRTSLTVVIPILSTMNIQVCPLPTAVLSTHTGGFDDYTMVDLTDFMHGCTAHWSRLGLSFDAIYSGFLGSPEQIDIVTRLILDCRANDPLVVIDPVMGDNGVLYGPFTYEMVEKMRTYIRHADVITPNLTEAALLLDEPYRTDFTEKEIQTWLPRLSAMGPKIVIITSAPDDHSARRTSVLAYNQTDKRIWKVGCEYIPAHYPGTGDAFASVITGSLLQGDSLPVALDRAVQFTSLSIRATFGHLNPEREGVLLERVLESLKAPVVLSGYELIEESDA